MHAMSMISHEIGACDTSESVIDVFRKSNKSILVIPVNQVIPVIPASQVIPVIPLLLT